MTPEELALAGLRATEESTWAAWVNAKAKAAKHKTWDASRGTEAPGNCPDGTWVWDLLNDLLQLAGDDQLHRAGKAAA